MITEEWSESYNVVGFEDRGGSHELRNIDEWPLEIEKAKKPDFDSLSELPEKKFSPVDTVIDVGLLSNKTIREICFVLSHQVCSNLLHSYRRKLIHP